MSPNPSPRRTAPGRIGVPTIGGREEESLDKLLERLGEQTIECEKKVGSARRVKVERSLEDKRKEVLNFLQTERARHPRRRPFRLDMVGREYHHIDAGYLVPLDPRKWKYEPIVSRIDPDAKPRPPGVGHGDTRQSLGRQITSL